MGIAAANVQTRRKGILKTGIRRHKSTRGAQKRCRGGTCLGLAISFNIIKDHDGELILESLRLRIPRSLLRGSSLHGGKRYMRHCFVARGVTRKEGGSFNET